MKQYVIDELRYEDYQKVKTFLDETCKAGALSGVYWMTVPDDKLTELQLSHTDCQPYHVGIELEEDHVSCGFLIRASGNIRCHCIAYATVEQRNWVIDTLDAMFEKIGIII
ncbi:MAG: hypothetical protein KKD44_01205 [Proteobacteria bacterium]|nr:hypothetical protein [Pseudomonadota bacterium]